MLRINENSKHSQSNDTNESGTSTTEHTSNISEKNAGTSANITSTKRYTVPLRIDEIKELLNYGNIPTLVDFEHSETEYFVNPIKYNKGVSGYDDNDIRSILNKKSCDFYTIISRIGGKLKYIKSGSTGHTFKGISVKLDGSKVNYGVKVVAYSKKEKYGNINDIRRPENAELMMIRLLSYFIINRQTPHIVLPIGTFNTSIKPFAISLGNSLKSPKSDQKDKYKRFRMFVKQYENGEYHDKVSILISEWANNGDLMDFIRNNYKTMSLVDWSVIFFQLISTLAIIQNKYPSFRHNDLKPNNILIHRIDITNKNRNFKYTVNDVLYIIPNIGFIIKLWDFDFACIPDIVDNFKVTAKWTSKINVKPKRNRYYDVHYFFNTLQLFFPEFILSNEVHVEIKKFVGRIIPDEYKTIPNVTERGRLLVDDEYIIPDNIIKNDILFKTFRKKCPRPKFDYNMWLRS
jgi:serine/threonine protein kinase